MKDKIKSKLKTIKLLEDRAERLDANCCGNGCQNCLRLQADVLREAVKKIKDRK